MEDGAELEGTFECSNRGSGRLRNREGSPAEGLDRLLARNDEAANSDAAGAGAGVASSLAERDEGRSATPPREQSPLPWQHQQEGGTAAQGGSGGGGDGNRGGTVASSVARLETAAQQLSAVSPTSAAGSTTPGAGGGESSRLAGRPYRPPGTTPTGAPSPATVAAAPTPRKIPPTGKSTSGTPPPVGDAGSLAAAGTPVGSLPPPPTPTSADARAPMRLSSPLRSGGLQVQSLGPEAAEVFSTEAVTPTGPSELPVEGAGTGTRQGRLALRVGGGGGGGGWAGEQQAGVGAEGGAVVMQEGSGSGSSTSVAARVGTWPPVSPAPVGRLWHRRQEVGALSGGGWGGRDLTREDCASRSVDGFVLVAEHFETTNGKEVKPFVLGFLSFCSRFFATSTWLILHVWHDSAHFL